MAIKLPEVQTFIVNKITDALYKEYNVKVNIGSVSYAFFNRLDIDKIYVEDLDADTLMYVDRLRLTVSKIGITTGKIGLGTVKLTKGEFNLHNNTEKGSTNIQDLVWRIAPPKQDTIPKTPKDGESKFSLEVSNVILEDFRFTMRRTPMKVYDDSARVNFTDLCVDSIYINLDNIALKRDTLFFDIAELHFIEKSGFKLHNLTANGYIVSTQAMLENVRIKDEYSDVQMGFFSLNFASIKSFKYFIEQVRMDALFSDSGYVSFQTLGYFAPPLRRISTPLSPKGFVTGTVANLKSDTLYISTLDRGVNAQLRFRLTGLPLIDETIIYGDVGDLHGNSFAVASLLNDVMGSGGGKLYSYILPLGGVQLKGKFTGLYNDFVATGRLKTGIGLLGVDALFTNSKQKGTTFKGRFSGLDFNVGRLLKSPIIERTSFDVSLEGKLVNGRLNTGIDGNVSLVELNKYPYGNISLAGQLETNSFDGIVVVNDPNLRLDFLGQINNLQYIDSIPIFDFTANIRHANLHELHVDLNNKDTVSVFRGLLQSNFVGRTWNTSHGSITLNNATYIDSRGEINIGNVLFSIEQGLRSYNMKLESEYLDASYVATASPNSMFKDFNRYLSSYLPSLTSGLIGVEDTLRNTYHVEVQAKKTGTLTQIVLPELYIAEGSIFKADLQNEQLEVELKSDKVYYGTYEVRNPKVKVDNHESYTHLLFTSDEVNNGKTFFMRNVGVDNLIQNDSIQSKISYDNKSKIPNLACLNLSTFFKDSDGRLSVGFKVDPSEVVVNGVPWAMSCDSAMIDSARFSVSKFLLGYKEQQLSLNGAYSSSSQDTLSLTINEFSLAYLDDLLKNQNINYHFDGTISGKAILFQYEQQPLFYANVQASNVGTNGTLLGDIRIRSLWNSEYEQLRLNAAIMRGANTLLNARGSYIPKTSDLEFGIEVDKFPLVHVEPLLIGTMSNLEGNLSGKYKFGGRPGKFVLEGSGVLNDGGLTIDFLNTHYKISGDVISDTKKISLINASASDSEGHEIVINNASASHDYFKRFKFNLDMKLNDAMALNTSIRDNDMFYGIVYARGNVSIAGPLSDIKINAAARIGKNTVFYIPLSTAMASRGGGELLSFYVPKDTTRQDINEDERVFLASTTSARNKKLKPANSMDVTLNLEATKDAEIQVIFDPRTNDVLKGAGSGGIKMNINPSKDIFTIAGTYTIDRGSYTLTIPNFNFIKKDFLLDRGGTVDFKGDVASMRFKLSATYDKTIKASLTQLLPYDQGNKAKVKYPIALKVNISGMLEDMKIDPIIAVSNIDSDTEAKVQSALNTDEKRLKQFLALLALNLFVPEDAVGQGNAVTSSTGNSAGLANLSEILSSQLSSIFAVLNLPVDFGVSYSTGADGVSNEIDVDFSYQINEKIIARGNVGNRANELGSQSTVSGDFDLEYLWKPSITLRAFSRSVDPYSDRVDGTNGRYGGAISYQNRFSNVKELWDSVFKRKKRRDAEAEEKFQKEREERLMKAKSTSK